MAENYNSKHHIFSTRADTTENRADEKLQEQDNTLEFDTDCKYYRNKGGRFLAKFNHDKNNNEIFSISKGIHKLTVLFHQSANPIGKLVTVSQRPKDDFCGKSVAAYLDPIIDSVSFQSENSKTVVEYTVTNNGVKARIIISEKTSDDYITFDFHCENVYVRYDDFVKRIAFISNETNDEIFFINPPFIKTLNDNMPYKIAHTYKVLENGDVQLIIMTNDMQLDIVERTTPFTIEMQYTLSDDAV